jgi:uncharacterized membrane protein (UPF0127 family)
MKSLSIAVVCLLLSGGAGGVESCRLTIRISELEALTFDVELATTPQARAIGLMGRKTLRPHSAMLFDFGSERPVSMWMKNTFVPLDMAFFREDGSLAHIARRTEPQSLRLIGSQYPVRYVLEINAGEGRDLMPAAGHRLDLAALSRCLEGNVE